LKQPITSFVAISKDQHLNGCNDECKQQSFIPSEHDNDSQAVIYSLNRDQVLPNVSYDDDDDETRPKGLTKL